MHPRNLKYNSVTRVSVCHELPMDWGSFGAEDAIKARPILVEDKRGSLPNRRAGDRLSHDDLREIFSSFGPLFGPRDIADLGTSFIAVFAACRVRAGLTDFPADDSPVHTATLLPRSAVL